VSEFSAVWQLPEASVPYVAWQQQQEAVKLVVDLVSVDRANNRSIKLGASMTGKTTTQHLASNFVSNTEV